MTGKVEPIDELNEVLVSPIADFKFDFQKLKDSVFEVIKRFPFDHKNQLCLTSKSTEAQSVYEGTGQLFDYERGVWNSREADYKNFNSALMDTYVFEVYKSIHQFIPWKIGRVRIMKLDPKKCYSFHHDADYRLHIAIETNPQCFLMFFTGQFVHIPTDGVAYFTNTLKTHSAMNGGNTDRYHLVFSTYED